MTASAAADGRLPPEPPGRPGRAQGLPHAELCPECFAQKLQHRRPSHPCRRGEHPEAQAHAELPEGTQPVRGKDGT